MSHSRTLLRPLLQQSCIPSSNLCQMSNRVRLLTTSSFLRQQQQKTTTSTQHDSSSKAALPEKILTSREQIEMDRKSFQEKYMDKIKKKMEEQKVETVEELYRKPRIPNYIKEKLVDSVEATTASATTNGEGTEVKQTKSKPKDSVGSSKDRTGIKPLSDILNLPLIFTTTPRPHTTSEISSLWQSYHSLHPTLSSTFLTASIPPPTYAAMIDLARGCPQFLVPLPRDSETEGGWEMWFLQWLFHPTPNVPNGKIPNQTQTQGQGQGTAGVAAALGPLPITSVMFTPLEEFKKSKEWAQPHLVLTHYPDLHNIDPSTSKIESKTEEGSPIHHPLVLMRGEILPSTSASAITSPLPGQDLALKQEEAQLLALALQRFYTSGVPLVGKEGAGAGGKEMSTLEKERIRRLQNLRSFGTERWSWEGLREMAYGGIV